MHPRSWILWLASLVIVFAWVAYPATTFRAEHASPLEQPASSLIVYNRDYVSKLRFSGNWTTEQTLYGVRWRPAGGEGWTVSFVEEPRNVEATHGIPVVGEVLVADMAVILNRVNQDTVPLGFSGVPSPGGASSARTTIYNWNNVIKFTTTGTCWGSVTYESNCTIQRCLPSGGSGDCKFTVQTTAGCTEHACDCNSGGTLNGWALCRVDGTLSTDCAGTTVNCP